MSRVPISGPRQARPGMDDVHASRVSREPADGFVSRKGRHGDDSPGVANGPRLETALVGVACRRDSTGDAGVVECRHERPARASRGPVRSKK